MDALVAAARKFSSDVDTAASYRQMDKVIKDTLSSLANDDFRQLALQQPGQALERLDLGKHTIIVAALLDLALKGLKTVPPRVLDITVEFLTSFNPMQGRYVGQQLSSILSNVGNSNLFPPLIKTELLTAAILQLDPTASIFTSHHLTLAKLAYNEDCIEQALPVLSQDVITFPKAAVALSGTMLCDPDLPPRVFASLAMGAVWSADTRPDSVLEYNFIRGLIYTSRRDWVKARSAFQLTITHPCKEKAVSKISVDAYKRWLLIGLIHYGEERVVPSYTATSVKTSCTSLAQPYLSIAKLFLTTSASQLKAEVEASTSTWTDDGTLSLVTEVLSAYQKWQIINLRQVYSQISIAQLRAETASAETGEPLKEASAVEALVKSMIGTGMLKGRLAVDSGTTYLTYHDPKVLLLEQDFARELARSHKNIQALGGEYKVVNERLSENKDYVKHIQREQKRTERDAENPSGGFETQIEDEDLMTGVVVNG